MTRKALVKNARSLREVEACLPNNYQVERQVAQQSGNDPVMFIITGEDVAGWTLDGYDFTVG